MNMKQFVKAIKEGLNQLYGKNVTVVRYLEHANVLTAYVVCTHNAYVNEVVPVCITYGGVMQNFTPQDDDPGEGQLWLYAIVFVNRTNE